PTPPKPPARPQADVSVRVARISDNNGHAIVRVTVSGIPAGQRARLSTSASSGDLRARWGACRGSTCTATRFGTVFLFTWRGQSDATLSFSVSGPDGYDDPSSGNNRSSV